MEERIQGYQYDILRLKDMLEEKMKEAEDIIAEKEELEFNVQNALHKLWAKEEELHAHRKSSLEREKSLLDRLRKESTRSEGLELQVPSLTKQKDTLQKQVYWLEQQLSLIEGATQQRKRELENKLPEIEGNNECLKKMTVKLMGQMADVLSGQNNHVSSAVNSSSCTSVEETSSELSSSEKCSEGTKESTEQYDLGEQGNEKMNLKEALYSQRKDVKTLMSNIQDIWRKVNADSKMHANEWLTRKDPGVLLDDIYEAYCRKKSNIVDLEEQNVRLQKHLHNIEEDFCTTEGRIQRIWVNISLNEEKDEEIHSGLPCAHLEETENALNNIERVLIKDKSILQENRDLKKLNASKDGKINDLQALVEKVRKEESEFAKELEVRNSKFEELKLSTNKIIQDKDVEIEILKEQLHEIEIKRGQFSTSNGLLNQGHSKDEILENRLQRKEREFLTSKNKHEKEEMALRQQIQELQEALGRIKHGKDDLEEYCNFLKEDLEKFETRLTYATEEQNSLKESLVQAQRKEEKLFMVARELYDEFQIKRQENGSQETTIVSLYEKIKCLEVEIHTTNQERQVDKKNLKNAEETKQYLESSLQQALTELFEVKAKKDEEIPVEISQFHNVKQDDHREDLLSHLKEVKTFIHNDMQKSVQDLDKYATKFGELCEVNNSLKKEVNEYKNNSSTLQKANYKLKILLQAMKDDLLEELKAKKEMEVLLTRANETSESTLPEHDETFDQSTSSQVQEIPLASSSGHTLHGKKKTAKRKSISKKIPKVISKHLSSNSLKFSRMEAKNDRGLEIAHVATSSQTTEADLDKFRRRETLRYVKKIPKVISKQLSSGSLKFLRKEAKKDRGLEVAHVSTSSQTIEAHLDKSTRTETLRHEKQLRSVVMTLQRDKEELSQNVESLQNELQKARTRLKKYGNLNESIRDNASRHVKEMAEMNKLLEAIYTRIEHDHGLITNDIQKLSAASETKAMQLQNLEQLSHRLQKDNVELTNEVAKLEEKLQDAMNVKEAALDEGRQLRVSLQTVLESKDKCLLPSESPLVINNLNTDVILPQLGKDEVRNILKDVLQEIELYNSDEVNRLKQSLAEQAEELLITREEIAYLKTLVDAGLHEELQKAEERIIHLKGQLKVCQERQKVLREAAMKEKVAANDELQILYERFAELKISMRSKEEALNRCQEMEEALMYENAQLQEEVGAVKERFAVDGLLLLQITEAKRETTGWKRKYQRLEEHFENEKKTLTEENLWLHRQLAEESSLCEEFRSSNLKHKHDLDRAEDGLKGLQRKLVERQETLASFEERRVALETKLACLQKANSDLQNELSKERFEADRNLQEVRNEFEATVKELKRHQKEGNNMLTKVFLLENAKEKLEHELKEKERKMGISFESFAEERSKLTERVRDLRISLEDEVRRRLDLEEKMNQIVKISVTEKEQVR